MKTKYIFLYLMAFLAMPLNAQNNLVVVKNDGTQLQFDLSKKPYMLFPDEKIQILSDDKKTEVGYLDFNYFSYQGKPNTRMASVVTTPNETFIYFVGNNEQFALKEYSKYLVSADFDETTDDTGTPLYTKNCDITSYPLNESSPYIGQVPLNSFCDIKPATPSVQPYAAFNIPTLGAGTYDLYLVTMPLALASDIDPSEAEKGYQFRVNIFYRTRYGEWPKTRNETLKNPADSLGKESYFRSNPLEPDTIFLGTRTFDADVTYNPSMMVQIQSYVSTKETSIYSRRMCFNCILMKARDEGFTTAKYLATNDFKSFSTNELEQINYFDTLTFTSKMVDDSPMSAQINVKADFVQDYTNLNFYDRFTLLPDNEGNFRIPFILFPGYEYECFPFVESNYRTIYTGEPIKLQTKENGEKVFSTEVSKDDFTYYITTKVFGMKSFREANRFYRSSDYIMGMELTNTATGEVITMTGKNINIPSINIEDTTLTDDIECSYQIDINTLKRGQKYLCRTFLKYGNSIINFNPSFFEGLCYYDPNGVTFTTPTWEEFDATASASLLPQMMARDASISLFNQAMKATHVSDLLQPYIDMSYHCSADSVKGRCYGAANEYDNVYYMESRYIGFTGFVEPDDVYASKGIKTLDDLRAYAKQVYDEMYPEDAGITDETDRRNSLNRFVSYHFLPGKMKYPQLTVDNLMLGNYNRKHWDVADWYETMMPHSIMKISFPSGSQAGRYINRRGVLNHSDERGVFEPGAKIKSPAEVGKDMIAYNGVYHYIGDIITYGRTTQQVVLNERMRFDATTLSPDFLTSGARGHSVRGEGGSSKYPGQYGVMNSSFDPNINPNTCLGFKAGAAQNFMFNDAQTHLHVRNRYLAFWSYQGDEVLLSGPFDVTVKLPPVPEGDYELRFQTCMGYATRGIVQFFIDGKPCGMPLGLPVDFRKSGEDQSIGWKSDDAIGDTEAILAFDHAIRQRGWMKAPASYGNSNSSGSITPDYMRNNSRMLRKILTTFHSDGKTDHYLRLRQNLESSNIAFAFDYIEICPRSVYDNEFYPEDRW